MSARKLFIVAIFLGSLFCTRAHGGDDKYLVISFLAKGDPYEKAGSELLKIRSGKGIRSSLKDFDKLLAKLKKLSPDYVAFIARPEQIDVNLAHRILDLSTRVDDDPFVDFSYGIITGRTPKAAVRLAQAGKHSESKKQKPDLGILGVADAGLQKKSISQSQLIPLAGLRLPMTWAHIAAGDAEGKQKFIEESLEQLESKSLFAFAGHGFPDRVVDGPTSNDLEGHDFRGAVAYNIACYTGVTSNWFETDYQSAKTNKNQVSSEDSFCLSMLETGVASYVAYSCARPAGPEMFADMLSLATEGISIGEQRRRHANSVILTHLSQKFDGLDFEEARDGDSLKVRQTTEAIVRRMSTGSLLFGDPAVVPFRKTKGAYPVSATAKRIGENLQVDVTVRGPLWHWFCSDQLEQTSMKLETRIPFGGKHVGVVNVDRLPFGKRNPAKKITAAVETHRGKTYLHLKATFNRPEQAMLMQRANGVSARFVVEQANTKEESDRYLHAAVR